MADHLNQLHGLKNPAGLPANKAQSDYPGKTNFQRANGGMGFTGYSGIIPYNNKPASPRLSPPSMTSKLFRNK